MAEFNFTRPLSTMKYGLYVGLASIPAYILIIIGYLIFFGIAGTAFEDGDFESGLVTIALGFVFMMIVQVVSVIQIFCFAFNAAFCDSVPSYQSMGYFGSWKKAVSIFLELIYLIIIIIVITIISFVIMDTSVGLGLIMLFIAGIMWVLVFLGLIPYVCRRILEKGGNDAGSKMNNLEKDPLEGLHAPVSENEPEN